MSGTFFAADPPADRPMVVMEAFSVLHHVPSGMTHLLTAPAPEILATISPPAEPADLATIIERLSEDYELDGDAKVAVAARLAELEAAGLVRRA